MVRLAVQAIWVQKRGLISVVILKGTKSNLLNKNKVSGVINGLNDGGTRMQRPEVVRSMTSGKGSTHIEIFVDLTLVIEAYLYSYSISGGKAHTRFQPSGHQSFPRNHPFFVNQLYQRR